MQCCSFDSAPRDRIEATTELNGRVPDSAPHGKMIVPASCCLTVTKATQARSHCFRWRLGASERGGCVQVPVSSLPSHSLSHLLKHLLYTFMAPLLCRSLAVLALYGTSPVSLACRPCPTLVHIPSYTHCRALPWRLGLLRLCRHNTDAHGHLPRKTPLSRLLQKAVASGLRKLGKHSLGIWRQALVASGARDPARTHLLREVSTVSTRQRCMAECSIGCVHHRVRLAR